MVGGLFLSVDVSSKHDPSKNRNKEAAGRQALFMCMNAVRFDSESVCFLCVS